jgi:hypothetical protein
MFHQLFIVVIDDRFEYSTFCLRQVVKKIHSPQAIASLGVLHKFLTIDPAFSKKITIQLKPKLLL